MELQAAVVDEMDRLDEIASEWVAAHGSEPYLSGMRMTGRDLVFTRINRDAAQRLADDMFTDLLRATHYVRRDVKRFIGEAAKIAAESTVVDNTATQAGRELMRDLIDNRGIKAVRFVNGATHHIGDYSDMLIRTKTAVHFNLGAFDGAPEVEWWECWDGPDCGLSSHDDFTLANGMIAERQVAQSYPISHPRCRRAWGPRPDIVNKSQAKKEQAPRVDREADALHAVGR
jgi:hypothetical protein